MSGRREGRGQGMRSWWLRPRPQPPPSPKGLLQRRALPALQRRGPRKCCLGLQVTPEIEHMVMMQQPAICHLLGIFKHLTSTHATLASSVH